MLVLLTIALVNFEIVTAQITVLKTQLLKMRRNELQIPTDARIKIIIYASHVHNPLDFANGVLRREQNSQAT